jgi:hypothetical protein
MSIVWLLKASYLLKNVKILKFIILFLTNNKDSMSDM